MMVIQKASLAHIDAIVDGGEKFGPWHLTGFYGNPNTTLRVESRNLLKSLSGFLSYYGWLSKTSMRSHAPWKRKGGWGGAPRCNHQMTRFYNSFNYCGLKEVGFVGPRFTWL